MILPYFWKFGKLGSFLFALSESGNGYKRRPESNHRGPVLWVGSTHDNGHSLPLQKYAFLNSQGPENSQSMIDGVRNKSREATAVTDVEILHLKDSAGLPKNGRYTKPGDKYVHNDDSISQMRFPRDRMYIFKVVPYTWSGMPVPTNIGEARHANNSKRSTVQEPNTLEDRSVKRYNDAAATSRLLENGSNKNKFRSCNSQVMQKYKQDAEQAFNIFFQFWPDLSNDPNDFNGTWQIILERSDPTSIVTEALGVSRIRRRALDTTAVTIFNRITWPNRKTPNYESITYLPLNNVRSISILADCHSVPYNEPDTGFWKVSMGWFINSFLMVSEGVKGTLYDRRAVLIRDPKKKISGHLQLQVWTLVPPNKGDSLTVVRLMKKL